MVEIDRFKNQHHLAFDLAENWSSPVRHGREINNCPKFIFGSSNPSDLGNNDQTQQFLSWDLRPHVSQLFLINVAWNPHPFVSLFICINVDHVSLFPNSPHYWVILKVKEPSVIFWRAITVSTNSSTTSSPLCLCEDLFVASLTPFSSFLSYR